MAWHIALKEAWPVVCLQCKTVRNKLSLRSEGSDLNVFCSLNHHQFFHNHVNIKRQIETS